MGTSVINSPMSPPPPLKVSKVVNNLLKSCFRCNKKNFISNGQQNFYKVRIFFSKYSISSDLATSRRELPADLEFSSSLHYKVSRFFCLKLKISITNEYNWFSILGNLHIDPGTILGNFIFRFKSWFSFYYW